jgi:nicotinate-nucleotide adenylyltransferase
MDRYDPDLVPAQIQMLAAVGGRIGLLGGSFNPAHEAHVHISLVAMRRLGLDAVWWLVAPQNPLKSVSGMAPLSRRLEQARAVARHPRIHVSAPEVGLGTRFTVDTVEALRARFPLARLAWLMGGDSMTNFHHWHDWPRIARAVPLVVVARPGHTVGALMSLAAQRLRSRRVTHAKDLFSGSLPAWIYLEERLLPVSATAIRARGGWVAAPGHPFL